jgi:hypothetical protein
VDYLKALSRTELTVTVGGKAYVTRTASLRTFFAMQQALKDQEQGIIAYLATAFNVPFSIVASWEAVAAWEALEAVQRLNTPQPIHLDFARQESPDKAQEYDYEGQPLVSIVTRLAMAFGWPRDMILDELTYDEARCYVQEILIRQHNDREYLYSLSEVGYTYDKQGKGRQQPFPRLAIPTTLPTETQATPVGKMSPPPHIAGVVLQFGEQPPVPVEKEEGTSVVT